MNEPMTATELEERYKILGAEIQNEMCKLLEPIIKKIIKLVEETKHEKPLKNSHNHPHPINEWGSDC
jgi:hypothetical protein